MNSWHHDFWIKCWCFKEKICDFQLNGVFLMKCMISALNDFRFKLRNFEVKMHDFRFNARGGGALNRKRVSFVKMCDFEEQVQDFQV